MGSHGNTCRKAGKETQGRGREKTALSERLFIPLSTQTYEKIKNNTLNTFLRSGSMIPRREVRRYKQGDRSLARNTREREEDGKTSRGEIRVCTPYVWSRGEAKNGGARKESPDYC